MKWEQFEKTAPLLGVDSFPPNPETKVYGFGVIPTRWDSPVYVWKGRKRGWVRVAVYNDAGRDELLYAAEPDALLESWQNFLAVPAIQVT